MKRACYASICLAMMGCSSSGPNTSATDAGPSDSGAVSCDCTTQLTAAFGSKTGAFTRAQFGSDSAADPTIRIEAQFGGDPACPVESSPTPDRTLIIANVLLGKPSPSVAVSMLDFKGDLTSAPVLKAKSIILTPRTCCSAVDGVAYDLTATFDEGMVSGTIQATHCASMDE